MFHIATVWTMGGINGYMLPENGLPTGYKYGALAIASGIQYIKAIGSDAFKELIPRRAVSGVLTTMFGVPIVMGAVFCTGSFLGKSVRHLSDSLQVPKVSREIE